MSNKIKSPDDVRMIFEEKFSRKLTNDELDILNFGMASGQ